MVKILAIDPSSTEVGLYDGEISFTVEASRKKPRAERLSFIMDFLSTFIKQNGPYDFVVYEEQFVRGNAATRALYGAVGVIEAVSVFHGAGTMPIPQGTLREWAKAQIGEKGRLDSKAAKELYRKVAYHFDPRMKMGFTSEHECDAAAIYYFVQHKGEFNA